MKTIFEIKREREARQTVLFKAVGLFFAFSAEQFSANKTALKEGEKYASIGMGGYLPIGNVNQFLSGMADINAWFRAEINQNKETRRALIAYELSNHEAYYSGSIDSTADALGADFTRAEIQKVFTEERFRETEANY